MSAASARADERMLWVLQHIVDTRFNGCVAWDADVVDAFCDDFPEANKALRVYTQGPNSCPMLNRAAARARDLGYLEPGSIGNQDARSFNRRTWCRYWSITKKGRAALTDSARHEGN